MMLRYLLCLCWILGSFAAAEGSSSISSSSVALNSNISSTSTFIDPKLGPSSQSTGTLGTTSPTTTLVATSFPLFSTFVDPKLGISTSSQFTTLVYLMIENVFLPSLLQSYPFLCYQTQVEVICIQYVFESGILKHLCYKSIQFTPLSYSAHQSPARNIHEKSHCIL